MLHLPAIETVYTVYIFYFIKIKKRLKSSVSIFFVFRERDFLRNKYPKSNIDRGINELFLIMVVGKMGSYVTGLGCVVVPGKSCNVDIV